MDRIIIEVNVTGYYDLNLLNIDGSKIKRVWTLYDESLISKLENNKNELGKMLLKHNQGVFLEDRVHDWNIINNNVFHYYTRMAEPNEVMKVILEFKQ